MEAEPIRREIAVNGVELVCFEIGSGERPFVLVHGFTGSSDDFREHLPALASLGRTVVFDQRGHGGSTNTGEASSYTFAQLVADLHALLGALAIERCDLLGHSMGGMVALRFALAHPDRVASLVLMDTAARAPDRLLRAPMAAGGAIARQDGMTALAELLRARAREDPNRPPASRRLEAEMGEEVFWERQRRRYAAMDPEAFASLGVLLADQEPVTHRLGEIRCPTRIIVGEQDVPFLGPSEELLRGIAGAVWTVVPDAAHSPQMENPGAWFAAIREHLSGVRSGAV